ncbi:hypothetical protein DIURU_003622 [Diutina rugosa]|uniref:Anaphase spindle elongation protein n=1 Tax=Diutina rugosa TaxID=5481 RepID=A0A642UL85_DIURU|nr:uncharacterized protein DIURU_003622 [Diutina rugosa]KAA8901252.1 hypothetical protein DIURU_003622 [Diutina rugosa]
MTEPVVTSGDPPELSPPSEMDNTTDTVPVVEKSCVPHFDSAANEEIGLKLKEALDSASATYESIGYSESEKEQKRQVFVDKVEHTIRSFALTAQQEKSALINECLWLKQQIHLFLEHIEDPGGVRLSESDRSRLSVDPNTTSPKSSISLLELKKCLHSVFLKVLKWFTESLTELGNMLIEYWKSASVVGMKFETPGLSNCFSQDDTNTYFRILKEFDVLHKEATNLPVSDVIIASPSQHNESFHYLQSPDSSEINLKTDTLDAQFQGVNYRLVQLVQGMDLRISKKLLKDITTETKKVQTCCQQREQLVSDVATECAKMINELELSEEDFKSVQENSMKTSKIKGDEYVEEFFKVSDVATFKDSPREFGLHQKHINTIQSWYGTLNETFQSMRAEVEEVKMKCISLWEKLDVDEEYQFNFPYTHQGYSQHVLKDWKTELSRLLILRSQHVEKYITSLRQSIQNLWSDMHYGPDQRNQWEYATWDNATIDKNDESGSPIPTMEKVLDDHETYFEKLKEEYASKEIIFVEYERFLELLSLKQQLIDSAKDPSRLTGSNAVSIGLKEARKHKEFAQNFPRVTSELKRLLADREEQFLVNDEPLLSVIELAETKHCRARSPSRSPQRMSPRKPQSGMKNASLSPSRRVVSSPVRRIERNIPDVSPMRGRILSESSVRSPTARYPGSKLPTSPSRSPRSRNLKPALPQEARRTPSDTHHVFDTRPRSPTKLPILRRPLQDVAPQQKRPLSQITNTSSSPPTKKFRRDERNDSNTNSTSAWRQ